MYKKASYDLPYYYYQQQRLLTEEFKNDKLRYTSQHRHNRWNEHRKEQQQRR
jgi:hypothetical protein